MSKDLPHSDASALLESRQSRRSRLIREGRKELKFQLGKIEDGSLNALHTAIEQAIEAAYRLGLDTMADIVQPEMTAQQIGEEIQPVKVLPDVQALAINGVIRLLLVARTEFALKRRFDGQVELPREEAIAMSKVVEAGLGLDVEKLMKSDLFETLP